MEIVVLEQGFISVKEPNFCTFCNPVIGPPGSH